MVTGGGGTPKRWVREVQPALWKKLAEDPADAATRALVVDRLVKGFFQKSVFTGGLSMYASAGTGEDLLVAAALGVALTTSSSISLLVLTDSMLGQLGTLPDFAQGIRGSLFLDQRHYNWNRQQGQEQRGVERLVDMLVPNSGKSAPVVTFTGRDIRSFGRNVTEFVSQVQATANGHWVFS